LALFFLFDMPMIRFISVLFLLAHFTVSFAQEDSLMSTSPLSPCPKSPNCVSSQVAPSDSHYIAPFKVHKMENPIPFLQQIIAVHSRVKPIVLTEDYLHFTYTSWLFGFIDDVEFLYDRENSLIHVRSASRTGWWDLGANRRRINGIRKEWEQALGSVRE
jgi:uncharacterized protein (DUF1499 family)